MLSTVLCLFVLAEALHVPLLVDPGPWLQRSGPLAGVMGVALLIVDVVLPVPASLVMIAHGAIFGLWVGMLLSLIGGVGAGLFAFFLGRRSSPLVKRIVPAEEQARGNAVLQRWGVIAIIATRPIPMLAETTAILAGASTMTWQQMLLATFVGTVPAAVLYALTGALVISLNSTLISFVVVLIVAGVLWITERHIDSR